MSFTTDKKKSETSLDDKQSSPDQQQFAAEGETLSVEDFEAAFGRFAAATPGKVRVASLDVFKPRKSEGSK